MPRLAVLSIITGGGKWVEIKISADPLYQHLLLTAEKKFWRCVESGEPPRLFGVEPPRARIEAVRIVDMSSSNAWAEFSNVFRRTREAYLEHENAKAELKGLMPEDAKEAIGHGVRAKRSKSGAVSFDVLSMEGAAMHRSSDTIGYHCGCPCQSPGGADQSGEIARCHHPVPLPPRGGPHLPLCPAVERAWTSSARALAGMRSRPSSRRRSIRKPASFASRPFLRIRPGNGFPRNGRYARSPISPRRSAWEPPSPMRGGMRFSRSWALPEKMISMRRISVPTPIPQRSCRDRRIIASNRMGKLRQRNGQRLVMESFQSLRQGPSSEYSYRQAFAKA